MALNHNMVHSEHGWDRVYRAARMDLYGETKTPPKCKMELAKMAPSGAMGEVARSLLDIEGPPRCVAAPRLNVAAAGPEMAGKASEPF